MRVSRSTLTLIDLAGGPKDNDLRAEIEKGEYPGIVKTTLDGVNQSKYLLGESDEPAQPARTRAAAISAAPISGRGRVVTRSPIRR